jgi:hypothetical protein
MGTFCSYFLHKLLIVVGFYAVLETGTKGGDISSSGASIILFNGFSRNPVISSFSLQLFRWGLGLGEEELSSFLIHRSRKQVALTHFTT